jgi:exonuclease III
MYRRGISARTTGGAGYNVVVHGQKAFNGVALLSKFRFDEVTPRLPGDDSDDHARFLEASSPWTTSASSGIALSAEWEPA